MAIVNVNLNIHYRVIHKFLINIILFLLKILSPGRAIITQNFSNDIRSPFESIIICSNQSTQQAKITMDMNQNKVGNFIKELRKEKA